DGMLHGRVLRPEASRAKLFDLNDHAARAVPGFIAVVRDGSFAGLVCETEASAEAALRALRKGATWSAGEALPDQDGLVEFLKAQPVQSTTIDTRTSPDGRQKARTLRRQYSRPYIAHASIAPSCAMAKWDGDCVHVWTPTPAAYLLP